MGYSSRMRMELCWFLIFEMFGVAFLVFFNTARSIDQFLFTGKEWMAGGTDLDFDFLLYRTNLNHVAAGANSVYLMIFRMDTFFHNP